MAGKKQLNATSIANELEGASAFFPRSPQALPSPDVAPKEEVAPVEAPSDQLPVEQESPKQDIEASQPLEPAKEEALAERKKRREEPSQKDSVQSREQASSHASVLAKIGKAVREIGKEVSYTRLTPEEKRRVLDIIYNFKSTGIRTTENELMRIAINFLLEDYDLHKEGSILHKILHQ